MDYNFVVNGVLLSSCAHTRNRYQMYLMERKAEERTEKGQKRKALMEELTSAKKAKEDLEKVSKKLVNTADKEAEKQKDSTAMKALLVESNAARSRSEEIQKKEIPGQEKEIKKIEERIKKIDY